MKPSRTPRLDFFKSTSSLLVALVVTTAACAHAATVYIGDSAGLGKSVTLGTGVDSAQTVTYAFVGTNLQGATYTAAVTTTLKITEVNFYKRDMAAGTSGTVTPFVAIYTGDLTNASVAAAANYSVISIGDPLSFSGASVASLQNLAFTVGGGNPVITLNAGQTLIAGFLNTGLAGMVLYDSVTQNATDYIGLSNTLPGSTPGAFTGSSNATLNRAQKFNIGFEVIPEPSSSLMAATGVGALLLRRRRSA